MSSPITLRYGSGWTGSYCYLKKAQKVKTPCNAVLLLICLQLAQLLCYSKLYICFDQILMLQPNCCSLNNFTSVMQTLNTGLFHQVLPDTGTSYIYSFAAHCCLAEIRCRLIAFTPILLNTSNYTLCKLQHSLEMEHFCRPREVLKPKYHGITTCYNCLHLFKRYWSC